MDHLPPGERVLLRTRPGFLFVLLHRQGWWLMPPLVLLLLRAAAAKLLAPDSQAPGTFGRIALAWLLVGLLVRIVAWLCRSYVLTDRRLYVAKGVVARAYAEVPLSRIQHTTLTQSLLERAFSLGTIGVATADGPAINWLMTPEPHNVLAAVRKTIDRLRPAAPPTRPPPVIGLAGGIGSGKSEVARILSSLGCVVIDSDSEAKQALDRPEVRDQLLQWWGPSIVEPGGRVSRKAVADIVFMDPAQRARLESLVHPIVRARRDDARARATAASAPAVVIDAPLLFEAGVDAECDAVIFVDAPREIRLARVQSTRGWSESELARREQSQLPLEEKRSRSHFAVPNSGDTNTLATRVREIFRLILESRSDSADT